jgi:hypothetical protein
MNSPGGPSPLLNVIVLPLQVHVCTATQLTLHRERWLISKNQITAVLRSSELLRPFLLKSFGGRCFSFAR